MSGAITQKDCTRSKPSINREVDIAVTIEIASADGKEHLAIADYRGDRRREGSIALSKECLRGIFAG